MQIFINSFNFHKLLADFKLFFIYRMSIIELVHTMSVAEKRHFTLYSGIKSKNNIPKYVKLFGIINKSPFITLKEISEAGFNAVDKNFLKEKIEESQHILYLGKSITSKLKWLTESMERYFKKQQWVELTKCIKKTKQISQQHEQYLDWLQAIYWEKEMLIVQPESRNLLEKLEIIIKEEQEVKENLLQEMNYSNFKSTLNTLLIKDIRLNKLENKEKFEQLISTDLLLNNNYEPNSFKSKIDFYQIKARIAKFKGDKKDAYYMAHKLFEAFINNPEYKNEYPSRYKKSLCFICDICSFSGKIEEIPALLELIGDDDQYFKAVCLYGILYSIEKLDRNRGANYLNKLKNVIDNGVYQTRPGGQLNVFYNGAVFWSLFSNWKEMDYWVQKILHFQRTDDRRDLQYAVRILSLFNHFELKSDDFDNKIQAVAHYFRNNNQNSKTNQYIIQSFRNLYKAFNRKEMIPIWTDLKNYLNTKIGDTNKATQQLGLGELSLWCTSKIENVSMEEIYKNS